MGEVCRAWREATLSPALWSHLYFRLPRDDDEETAEAFVSWLLPRVGQVETLHIDIQDVAQVGAWGSHQLEPFGCRRLPARKLLQQADNAMQR